MTPEQPPLPSKRTASRSLLTAAVIITLVAGVVIGREYLARTRPRTHFHAAIPKICGELSQQRQLLQKAIEAYKAKLGFYPPDHVISRQPLVVDTVTNPLLYELLGTWQGPAADTFTPARFPAMHRSLIKSFFDTDGFKNSAAKADEVQHFLDAAEIEATVAVSSKPDVGLLGYYPDWEGIEPDIYSLIGPSSWRYNSSAPVHNPGSFDLWIEIITAQTNILIGNW
jgi:hypothetical protein